MKFDDILINYVGEFGTYQKVQFILVCLPTIFTALHSLSWTFTGASIPYRCMINGENDTNLLFDPKHNYSTWLYGSSDKKHKIKHFCERVANFSIEDIAQVKNFNGSSIEPCVEGYKWDTSEITNTALKKWEMVCDKNWLKSFIQSMYYVGQFFGSIVFGMLADKTGRKNIFFIAILLQIICGAAMAYIPYWPLFAILRIGVGFAHPGIFVMAVVIGIELVGPSRRVLSSAIAGIFFAIGEIILGSLAYGIRDYQPLQLAISLPALIFIVYYWIVPESARWLISQKRINEAGQILQRVAKVNKRSLPDDWHKQLDTETTNSSTVSTDQKPTFRQNFVNLFKTPNIRKRSFVCFFCWPTVSMAYYGLAMNPNFLGGDRYLAFIVGGVSEIVAILIVIFTMNIVGRKVLLSGGFLFAAACLFLTLPIADGTTVNENMRMVLVIVGKMSLTGVYAVIYVVTPEVFPTVIRSTAMGICSMIARVGATAASYIALWLVDISRIAVVLIFGILCLVAGLLALLLPETTDQLQLETLEDAENFGTNQPILYFVWRKRTRTGKSSDKRKSISRRRSSTVDNNDENYSSWRRRLSTIISVGSNMERNAQ